ncbi:hypothetical protein DFH08DRAFT_960950 [Mycena albidolilacea]|uniref:RPEL repeat protein n=1 Tax=Mycena albidolilacea TaxID=1033008 RepID=A0AAD6ZZF2_9AGAR|nr:hypothetical protein DFH08DRAFT_960950 [Mycena albidolilacea]
MTPLYISRSVLNTSCSVTTIINMSTRPSHPRQASVDEKTQEFLESKLAQRPDKSELIERNILKDDKGLAPALVAAREQLQRSQLQDKLAGNIASRPPREELEQKGILKGASS